MYGSECYEVNDFHLDTRSIGQGAFGLVYRVTHKKSNNVMAIKASSGRWDAKAIKKEIGKLIPLRCQYIIGVYGLLHRDGDPLGIVMEYAHCGSVHSAIEKLKPLPWSIRIRILCHCALALQYLHKNNMLHLDLKTPNILLDNTFTAKVCDFGEAARHMTKTLSQQGLDEERSGGTLVFVAPELLRDISTPNSRSLDVYAFAITTWTLLAEKWPYADYGKSEQILIIHVKSNLRPATDAINPPERYQIDRVVIPLMERCWSDDSKARPTFDDIVRHLKPLADEFVDEAEADIPQLVHKLEHIAVSGPQQNEPQQNEPQQNEPQPAPSAECNVAAIKSKPADALLNFKCTPQSSGMELSQVTTPSRNKEENRVAMIHTNPAPFAGLCLNTPECHDLQLTHNLPGTPAQAAGYGPMFSSPGAAAAASLNSNSMKFSNVDTNIPGETEVASDELLEKLSKEIIHRWKEFMRHLKLSDEEISYVNGIEGPAWAKVYAGLKRWKFKEGRHAIRKWILAILVYMGMPELVPLMKE